LCYPEETLPSGGAKEKFGRMISKKNLPRGTVLRFSPRRLQLLVEVRRGAGTCPHQERSVWIDLEHLKIGQKISAPVSKGMIVGGDGSKPGLYNFLVQKIAVGVLNAQMFKVTSLKFKS